MTIRSRRGPFKETFRCPALLVPMLAYNDFEIGDADTASTAPEALLLAPADSLSTAKRKRLRSNLLAFCRRDTEALVALAERLRSIAT